MRAWNKDHQEVYIKTNDLFMLTAKIDAWIASMNTKVVVKMSGRHATSDFINLDQNSFEQLLEQFIDTANAFVTRREPGAAGDALMRAIHGAAITCIIPNPEYRYGSDPPHAEYILTACEGERQITIPVSGKEVRAWLER